MTMHSFDHAFLGFATTSLEALAILKEVGCFYLLVASGYFITIIFGINDCQYIKKKARHHIITIILWAVAGLSLIYEKYSLLIIIGVTIQSISVLWYLNFLQPTILKTYPKNSEALLTENNFQAKKFFKKRKMAIADFLSFSFINEKILWWIILFKSLVALRASLVLI